MLAIRTILHPTDFSVRSDYAFQMADSLARDHGARMVLLHVIAPPMPLWSAGMIVPPVPDEDRDKVQDKLLRMWPANPGIRVQHLLVEGSPAAEILRIARENECDLIVMGTHGWTGLTRLLLGSVAEEVMRKADCSVLTVKAPFPTESLPEQPASEPARLSTKIATPDALPNLPPTPLPG